MKITLLLSRWSYLAGVLVACTAPQTPAPKESPPSAVPTPTASPAQSPAATPTAKPEAAAPSAVRADANRLRASVAWLADDALQGRRAGTPSAMAAADWLAEELASCGLEPAGERGGWLQEFSVPLAAEAGSGTMLSVASNENASSLRAPDVAPLFCSESAPAAGPLAFRGYGMIVETQHWDDYGDDRINGAIAVILRGTPPDTELLPPSEADTQGVTHAASWESGGSIFNKVMTAKRFGATAVLLVQGEQDTQAMPFDPSQPARCGIPALSITQPVFERIFGADRARELRADAAKRDRSGRRAVTDVQGVMLMADVKREKGTAMNVLGRLRGADPARTIVVGAHYDHLGLGGEGSLAPEKTGEVHNGADDNASGTAAVLEMARELASGPKPAGDIVFALWSGEELGLLGSEHWMQHPTMPLEQVRANLNLDMVGRAGPATPPTDRGGGGGGVKRTMIVLGAGTSAPFANWLDEAGRVSELELSTNASGQSVGGSDHMSFMKRKIPVLHFFTGVHADYHKPSDDTDKIDFEGLRRVVELGVDCVRRMQAEPTLAWVDPPEVKEAAQKPSTSAGGFRVWFGTVPEYSYEGVGLKLSGTSPGSPAEKAGMLAGDVLLQVGDITIGNIHDFVYALSVYKPGDVVTARFARDGEEQTVRITLATRQKE